jgi:hypothetical protein
MVITTSAGTQNYRFSVGNISSGVASTGHVIGFDSAGPFTAGVMRKQNSAAFSTAQVTGNYAFGASSPQNTAQGGGKFGAIGVINLAAGVVAGGAVDFNQNGTLDGNAANTNWPNSPTSITSSGSYTISGTNGRGTITFTPAGAAAVHEVLYVVSATDVLILAAMRKPPTAPLQERRCSSPARHSPPTRCPAPTSGMTRDSEARREQRGATLSVSVP